jgi:hypothetical protein
MTQAHTANADALSLDPAGRESLTSAGSIASKLVSTPPPCGRQLVSTLRLTPPLSARFGLAASLSAFQLSAVRLTPGRALRTGFSLTQAFAD